MIAKEVGSIEELETRVMNDRGSFFGGIFITTSINEEHATCQLPMLFKYSSRVDVHTGSSAFFYREGSEECPDNELIRCCAREHSLQLGLLVAKRFEKKMFEEEFRPPVKVDELSIGEAERVLSSYVAEFKRTQKEHEGYTYE
ncbi:MAG: hypothetical protein Q8N99_04195 [Nanoarchaeota archaeon]|nr:hypothetical protein [Nanoarchaeota archaeon]